MSLARAFTCFMISVQVFVSAFAFAGGTMKVPLTPERIEACRRLLTENGMDLPPGAQVTGIEITAEDWVCASCKSEVDGMPASFPKEVAQCNNCGSPMEPKIGELYKKNPEGKLKLRDDQIDAALTMGQNWSCDYCGTGGNRNKIQGELVKDCGTCGAPRADFEHIPGKNTVNAPAKKWDGQKWKPTETPVATQARPPRFETTVEPTIDGMTAVREETDTRIARGERDRSLNPNDLRQILIRNKKGVIIGGGIVVGIGLLVFRYLTLQDTPDEGLVVFARWIQTVRIEQFQPVIDRGKKEDIRESEPVMPVNGKGEQPGKKIIECSGNSCLYETYKWMEIDSKVMRGNYEQPIPGSPAWAKFEAPANGRVMTNTRYDVDLEFSHNGEKFTSEWRPETYEQFQQFKPGSKITVKIDPLRNIETIK